MQSRGVGAKVYNYLKTIGTFRERISNLLHPRSKLKGPRPFYYSQSLYYLYCRMLSLPPCRLITHDMTSPRC